MTVGDKAYSVVGFLYVQSRILKMFMFVFLLQEIMTEKIEFFFHVYVILISDPISYFCIWPSVTEIVYTIILILDPTTCHTHSFVDCFIFNPCCNQVWCFSGEDMQKRVQQLAQASVKGNNSAQAVKKIVRHYRLAMEITWLEHQEEI